MTPGSKGGTTFRTTVKPRASHGIGGQFSPPLRSPDGHTPDCRDCTDGTSPQRKAKQLLSEPAASGVAASRRRIFGADDTATSVVRKPTPRRCIKAVEDGRAKR